MADADLLDRAARCYLMAGVGLDAARCYQDAGAHRAAADLLRQLRHYRESAEQYVAAGLTDEAAWVLAHLAGDPAAARALLSRSGSGSDTAQPTLTRRLALARCDVAEGVSAQQVLQALIDAQAALERRDTFQDRRIEDWAVAVAEAAHRFDHVALVFAAAVRGGRRDAAQRWQAWATRTFGAEIQIAESSITG